MVERYNYFGGMQRLIVPSGRRNFRCGLGGPVLLVGSVRLRLIRHGAEVTLSRTDLQWVERSKLAGSQNHVANSYWPMTVALIEINQIIKSI